MGKRDLERDLVRSKRDPLTLADLPVGALDLHTFLAAFAVGYNGRVLVWHLQEAFHARWRVLGALPFIAVGQEHHEPRLPQPLLLSRRDELVDDNLGGVAKVPKLRLPNDLLRFFFCLVCFVCCISPQTAPPKWPIKMQKSPITSLKEPYYFIKKSPRSRLTRELKFCRE